MSELRYDANRRRLLQALAGAGLVTGLGTLLPAYGRGRPDHLYRAAARVHGGQPGAVRMDFNIRREGIDIAGGRGPAHTVNHRVPGPLLELYEGHEAQLRVINHLDEMTSIHWHGLLIPFRLDGVPGVTGNGVQPGETFPVDFTVRQSGTYWYHSHAAMQEQTGLIGPIVIHPAQPDSIPADRDYVMVLSDWTFEDPQVILDKLKSRSDYYNFNELTVGDFFDDVRESGWQQTINNRLMWGAMRMSPTDIADVTGHTYSYLLNGLHPAANWTGLFRPGERVRLRFINASAMTYFNVRIPGMTMTVVAADGQNVQPVAVEEFQIAVAETFDVIVEPRADRAYTVMAESMDRSGYARATLAPRPGMTAPVPALREPPLRTMKDMDMGDMGDHAMPGDAMQHGDMSMGDMPMGGMNMRMPPSPGSNRPEPMDQAMDHASMNHSSMVMATMQHETMAARPEPEPSETAATLTPEDGHGRLGEPGTGLADVGHRVLTYTDLKSRRPLRDKRPPGREIEVHLTGNMNRYMWSFDGVRFSDSTPIEFRYGERLRLTLINDTMMEHPIHLHGMFMDLENGHGDFLPRKHTISVKPAGRVSLLITADEPGRWAFHCHLLYHMEMGMFRVVRVRKSATGGEHHA